MCLITYLNLIFFLSTKQTLGVHSTQELDLEYSGFDTTLAITPIRETFPHFTNLKTLYGAVVKPADSVIILRCVGGGRPTPNITWYKNDRIVEGNHLRGWSLKLEDLTFGDTGNYTCVVCNKLGCINHTIDLEVIDRWHTRPLIMNYINNLTVAINSTALFECQALENYDPQHSVQWFHSKNLDNKIKDGTLQNSSTIDGLEILRLPHVTIDDEGWYSCLASNSLGYSAGSAYLKVIDEYNLPVELGPFSNGMATVLLKSWNWNVLTAFAFILLKIRKDM